MGGDGSLRTTSDGLREDGADGMSPFIPFIPFIGGIPFGPEPDSGGVDGLPRLYGIVGE